jgi:hypothetical protein
MNECYQMRHTTYCVLTVLTHHTVLICEHISTVLFALWLLLMSWLLMCLLLCLNPLHEPLVG